jgi:hypothetical protein
MNNAQTTLSNEIVNGNEATMPSINAGDNAVIKYEIAGKVMPISSDVGNAFQGQQLVSMAGKVSLENAIVDNEVITPKTVNEYTLLFKKAEELSAREILAMCRVVYEANKSLNSAEFSDFCQRIGYKDTSSAIRKQIVIGKLQPRLVNHAEALPATWTGIYSITQIPAQEFEMLMDANRSFKEMPNSKIQELVKQTRDLSQVGISPAVLTLDEKKRNILKGTVVAKVYFSKQPDDLDWKAFEKAMREVEANLPLNIQITADLHDLYVDRKLKRYEKIKTKQAPKVFKPETWDMGSDVAAMRRTPIHQEAPNDAVESAA